MIFDGTDESGGVAGGEGGVGGADGGAGGDSISGDAGGTAESLAGGAVGSGAGEGSPAGAAGGAAGSGATDAGATNVITWNGEVATLGKEPWFAALSPEVQAAVKAGLEAKHKNWEKGWRPAYESNATEKARLAQEAQRVERLKAKVDADSKQWLRWLHGEEDPTAVLSAENARLTAMVERMKADMDAAAEQQVAAAASGNPADIAAARAEAARVQQEFRNFQAAIENHQQAEWYAAGDELFDWMRENERDIIDNDDAYAMFVKLVDVGGLTVDEMLSSVRARYPKAEVARPDELPRGLRAMNSSGTSPSRVTSDDREDYPTKIARSYVEAAEADRRALGG